MDVPEEFQPIMVKLLQQLIDFKKSYGSLPKVQLVISEDYANLVNLLKRRSER